MTVGFLTNRCEFAEPKRYNGSGELMVAAIGCVLWFSAIVIRLSFSSKPWTLAERLVEATSFLLFAAVPIFFLATSVGAEFAKRVLLRNNGFWFQTLTCLLLGFYISVVKLLALNPQRFSWLKQFDSLIVRNYFWLNVGFFLAGVFVVLRLPFLLLELRDRRIYTKKHQTIAAFIQRNGQLIVFLLANFLYVSLVNTSLLSTAFDAEYSGYFIGFSYIFIVLLMNLPIVRTTSSDSMMVFDLLLAVACLTSLFWFSRPAFSFGPFISLTLFVLILVYGTGLGRAHFGYSFAVRKADALYTAKLILLAIVLLVPLAFWFKFTPSKTPSGFDLGAAGSNALFFLSYAILFSFRVGIFEEVLFRSGLMVFIRDQLQARSSQPWERQQLVLVSAIVCSLIFGLCHIGNNPGSGIALSPLQYKAIYAMLATLASMFYSLAFGETNRLWASITIHGVVDTTAVLVLGASLVVPF
ncbi:MAG: CPBP family intramembrane glutamic endopeptidase [Leptolyngbya sp. BL-A-14]